MNSTFKKMSVLRKTKNKTKRLDEGVSKNIYMYMERLESIYAS